MPGGVIAFSILAILVFIAITICDVYAAAKRRQSLMTWAQSKGLVFSPEKDRGVDSRFPAFSCLQKRGYAQNTMKGDYSGRPLYAFDYHWTGKDETTSTDSKGSTQRTGHYFSAVVMFSKVPLKPLLIRPEGLSDKVTAAAGSDHIDFESAEFSRKFFVKSPDRKWAYDVIHARTIEFLLAMPQFHIQLDRDCVMAWHNRQFSAAEFQQAAEVIKGILDRLPEYVVKQQEGES